MQAKITAIIPNEDMDIEVRVNYWDDARRPHNSGNLVIFIPQKDYTLSELKTVALEESKKFLSQCPDARTKSRAYQCDVHPVAGAVGRKGQSLRQDSSHGAEGGVRLR